MDKIIRRLYVELARELNVQADNWLKDLRDNLKIDGLKSVNIIERYDIQGLTEDEYRLAKNMVFSQPSIHRLYDEEIEFPKDSKVLSVELLPGQHNSKGDLAEKNLYILTGGKEVRVRPADVIIMQGEISDEEFEDIKSYIINPVESREASVIKPETLELKTTEPEPVEIVDGFIDLDEDGLRSVLEDRGLAMSMADLKLCQSYFRDEEGRNPTITEVKVLDTYWSDHCRHTTFSTHIESVEIENTELTKPIQKAYEEYIGSREYVYGDREKPITLMDIATMGMRELKKNGKLDNLDESEEINAASIVVPVDIDGTEEEWLIMFKNETHNHPTEIEPFGGAATCLGGAIRDPLSGRSYVYQAMRITGSGDPRMAIEDTLPGKLPQRLITKGAAEGYSSYGRGIGLAAGHVAEIYHEGFLAKRMELGAVIAAAPKENVRRESPTPGDIIVLVGGRTGRDGCGGATGSSKAHTETSSETCSSEVQKGNPVEERKIQRLFRKSHVARMIKKCNDFGAGGVSVAIGELAPGLEIDLDLVPVKYQGLDGTELAISESQERMAVVIDRDNVEEFIAEAREENLEATTVAIVTEEPRLLIKWHDRAVVDISRAFLDTNGAIQSADVYVEAPREDESFFDIEIDRDGDIYDLWLDKLSQLNVCSQKGLMEMFDSSAGAGTVLSPFGGKYQQTPAQAMVAKLPILSGHTNTATIMSHGYDPYLSEWSPFHGGLYAIVEAVSKIVAIGGDYRRARLSLQEYFERLEDEPSRWGKPFAALLGAHMAQLALGTPSIGGKDSMSGTFHEIDVPPTVVSFGVNTIDVDKVISPEFKRAGSKVVLLTLPMDETYMPDFCALEENYSRLYELANESKILSAHTVGGGGLCESISKMCFGNMIGFKFNGSWESKDIFRPAYGSIVVELDSKEDIDLLFKGTDYSYIGDTQEDAQIHIEDVSISLAEALDIWTSPLEEVFPTTGLDIGEQPKEYIYRGNSIKPRYSLARPRVLIPVFPGSNGEYEAAKAFESAGAIADILVFKKMDKSHLTEGLQALIAAIDSSQMIMLPGGIGIDNEPEGAGTAIATTLMQEGVAEAIMHLLQNRDGLILGVGSGFGALLKLGLLPNGEIDPNFHMKMGLAPNTVGRHVSNVVGTKVVSNKSPWLRDAQVGEVYMLPVSHAGGRLIAGEGEIEKLASQGQIATQYVDLDGRPTLKMPFNPTGSVQGIEGITSPDGKIFGRLAHPERIGKDTFINIPGERDIYIFKNGVEYFK